MRILILMMHVGVVALFSFLFFFMAEMMFVFSPKLRTGHSASRELRSCVKVEVDVLGSPSLIVPTVSVDIEPQ